ncbi:PPOX class F420-dependent oxidoreductase [Mycobacteroides abscessus subsp. abscessus]|uniref:PPOX class F420-dependent oxidoreductase n=1 Tax=Mycobacteroides abscessus TaxID=36809 RepID=UPI0019D17824|nr:PPOX class F420-dependent oxidoreductase [Mycobacteroides abscessus]MBN7533514.1 PPOX class F420-dependent oxidoreductase [Mycobacteroides abscessus subsp. abscessus]
MELNDAARALIGAGADATLVTVNPDGSPQVSVVWVALQSTPDGDELVAAHLSGNYKKLRNIRRDPHVALTVLAPSQPGQQREYLAVTGSARVVEGGAPQLLRQLAVALLGSDEHFPPPNSPEGYLTRIRVESVGGHGPWA